MTQQLPLFSPPAESEPVDEEDRITAEDMNSSFFGLPVIHDVDLYLALETSYSAGDMFKFTRGVTDEAQTIKKPVEHDGKFYTSFSGSAAPCRMNSRGESICILEENARRLYALKEYQGTFRTHVRHLGDSELGYEGILVVDPQGRKWVIGKDEFTVMVFETDNDFLLSHPDQVISNELIRKSGT